MDAHTPIMQRVLAGHTMPQRPQFRLSLASVASQPLSTMPSQSPEPLAHEYMHAPRSQETIVPDLVGQTFPQ